MEQTLDVPLGALAPTLPSARDLIPRMAISLEVSSSRAFLPPTGVVGRPPTGDFDAGKEPFGISSSIAAMPTSLCLGKSPDSRPFALSD